MTVTDDRPTTDEIAAAIALGADPSTGTEAAPVTSLPVQQPYSPCAGSVQQVQSELDGLTARVARLETAVGNTGVVGPNRPLSNDGGRELGQIGIPGGPGVPGLPGGPGDTGTTAPPPPVIPALSKTQGPDPIAGIGYMTTTAVLSQGGRLDCTTTVRSAKDLVGFTGGVIAVAYDDGGNILGRSGINKYGVDGIWVGASTRTVQWSADFGAAAATATRLGVVHFYAPTPRFWTDIEIAIQDIGKVADMVKQFCQQLPAVCTIIGAALAL